MNATDYESQHEGVALLLPWFVNETLDDAEREQVARHLAVCDECADAVYSLRAVQGGLADDKLTPITPAPNPQLVLERADSRAANRRTFAIAASIVLAASILFVTVATEKSLEPTVFETATGADGPVEILYGIRLKFVEGTSNREQQEFFERIEALSVSDESGGAYTASIALTIDSLEELQDVVSRIASYPEVAEASISSITPAPESSQ